MTGADVLAVLDVLDSYASRVWIDGGWGVDALVGEQTRDHTDLDLAVDQSDLPGIEQALAAIGYRHDATAAPGLPARFVVCDDGRQIDIHPLHFDHEGNGWRGSTPPRGEARSEALRAVLQIPRAGSSVSGAPGASLCIHHVEEAPR